MAGLNEKDIYHLWWEYLKRSDDYMAFCAWHRERAVDGNVPLPKQFRKVEGGIQNHPFTFIFSMFSDIHSETYRGRPYSFEVWWQRQAPILDMMKANGNSQVIRDYSEKVTSDIQSCVETLKNQEGRKLSFKDFKGFFAKNMKNSFPPKLYLEINLTRDEIGPLIRQINEMILEKKNDPRIIYWQRFMDRTNWPNNKITFITLKRYLLIYDLDKAGMKMGAIVKKIGTKAQRENYNDENIHAAFREELAKARTIIKNVEGGTFPGFYGKYSI